MIKVLTKEEHSNNIYPRLTTDVGSYYYISRDGKTEENNSNIDKASLDDSNAAYWHFTYNKENKATSIEFYLYNENGTDTLIDPNTISKIDIKDISQPSWYDPSLSSWQIKISCNDLNVLRNPNLTSGRASDCAHARTGYYLSKEAQEDLQEEAEASICPIGSYCPGGELTSPISCPNNTTTESTGKSKLSHCNQAKKSYYQNVAADDTNNTAITVIACPSNTTTIGSGSSKISTASMPKLVIISSLMLILKMKKQQQ